MSRWQQQNEPSMLVNENNLQKLSVNYLPAAFTD
jgi:hypothetical protein